MILNIDGEEVPSISEYLTPDTVARPYELKRNSNLCFQGSIPNANGLLLTPFEAAEIIARSPHEKQVVRPFLDSVNDQVTPTPERWCIFFENMDEKEASRFSLSFSHVVKHAKQQKLKKGGASARNWWRFYRYSPDLYATLSMQDRAFVSTMVTKHLCFSEVPTNYVFTNKLAVIASESWSLFAALQSSFHDIWARQFSGRLGPTLSYTPTDCFLTFPLPQDPSATLPELEAVAKDYHVRRANLMKRFGLGLTILYNRFHQPGVEDVSEVRELHRKLDTSVAVAYGWMDLAANGGAALRHDFHETKQGVRWTPHPDVRRDVLDRLLALNHERHAEEVAAGLHDKKGGGKKKRKASHKGASVVQELNLDFGPAKAATPRSAKETVSTRAVVRSSSDIGQTALLNAIFTCTARREYSDREDLAKEVATALGFQRLREKTRDLLASGFNSAIRRGLIGYEGTFIVRVASTYADLELDTLVKAITATVRPRRVYTPEEVFYNAAEHLGCKRLGEPFRESLQSALNAASRRGLIRRRGDEVRKAD